MPEEMFISLLRPTGDLAGVFEYDGKTGYFYLYQTTATEGQKIIDSLHVISGNPDFAEKDVSISWDVSTQKVALFIRNVMWALFDCTSGAKFGGNYRINARPDIAQRVEFIRLKH